MFMLGDVLMLRDGTPVKFLLGDPDSGWPIVELPNATIIAIDPAEIEDGYDGRD